MSFHLEKNLQKGLAMIWLCLFPKYLTIYLTYLQHLMLTSWSEKSWPCCKEYVSELLRTTVCFAACCCWRHLTNECYLDIICN